MHFFKTTLAQTSASSAATDAEAANEVLQNKLIEIDELETRLKVLVT